MTEVEPELCQAPQALAGDAFPACTPNTCDAGYDCFPDGSFGYCRCFSRVRECFEGPWPICGGYCLNGGQCIDSATGFCRCTP